MMALLYDSAAVGTLFEAKRMKLLMTQLPRSRGTADGHSGGVFYEDTKLRVCQCCSAAGVGTDRIAEDRTT